MIRHKIENFFGQRRCTLLGIGPMSQNCVDVAIELANKHYIPLKLIASRRQIEAEDFGGGYVNNWSTERFADYVSKNDKRGKIILARDHGGPWQNTFETEGKFSLREAMASAKQSYLVDIQSGFELIHLDPSIDLYSSPRPDEVLERLFELYEFCWSAASSMKRDIGFEIGTDEQSGSTNNSEELEYTLSRTFSFCKKNRLPTPIFVVMQLGTKVMETRNIGSFDKPLRVPGELPPEIQVPKMIDTCKKYNILLKSHNTDYLSDEALEWHPKLGIHSANVAPEYGVEETRKLFALMDDFNLGELKQRTIAIALASNRWKKWMLPNSKATEFDKAVICGHYIFSNAEFQEIKAELARHLAGKGLDLDEELKKAIRKSIMKYISLFRLN